MRYQVNDTIADRKNEAYQHMEKRGGVGGVDAMSQLKTQCIYALLTKHHMVNQ